MEFITAAILSGIVYDLLKSGMSTKADNLKSRFKDWVLEDSLALELENQIDKLDLNDEMSEAAIERKIKQNPQLLETMALIKKQDNSTTINQTHNGVGDNIGRDKLTN